MIALRSDYDKYVVCEYNGDANANRPWLFTWEKFYVYATENCDGTGTDPPGVNCIAFKSYAHDKWLVAEDDGSINCNRDEAGPWEKWYGWKDPPSEYVPLEYNEYGGWVYLGEGETGVYLQ